ncbi:MAG: general stress protein CsbD [Bacteroidota bacterium]
MSKLQLHKPWHEVREQLKEINADLTDDELIYEEGKEEVLLNRLSRILNMSPDEVRGFIESVSYNEGKAS